MSSKKNSEASSDPATIRSQFRASTYAQSVYELNYKEKTQDLMLPKVDFVDPITFKKESECYVCKQEFTQTNRQHHCRMCSNSCCGFCSEKTINKTRVCDICYLKASQLAAEKKRNQFIKAMKEQVKKLKWHIDKAKQKRDELETDCEKEEQKSKSELILIEKETEQYRLQYSQITQQKVSLEEGLNQITELISKLNQRKEQLHNQYQEKELEIKAFDTNLYLKEQELKDRQSQLLRIQKQKDDLFNAQIFIEQDSKIEPPIIIQEQLISAEQNYNINVDVDEMMNYNSQAETKDTMNEKQILAQQKKDEKTEKQEQYSCNIF